MPSDAIVAQLDAYRSLARDWDGHGAEPFAVAHIAHAARVAQLLADYADLMRIMPYGGSIQIELHRDGRFAGIDVVHDGTVHATAGTDHPPAFPEEYAEDAEGTPCTDAQLLRLAAWVGDGDGDGQGDGAGGKP